MAQKSLGGSQKFLICVDPESYQFYTINLSSDIIHIEDDVPLELRQKAIQSIQEIEKITEINHGNWFFHSAKGQRYRRRKIPSYLIQQVCSDYPRYICQSKLSLAFAEDNTLKISMDIHHYHYQFPPQQRPGPVQITVGLVNGADEIIKVLLRQIYQRWQILLQTKDEKGIFILKASGFHEYLYGPQPLLSYDRIRTVLRGIRQLTLILTQMKESVQKGKFPACVEQQEKKVMQGKFQMIDWNNYLQVPLLLWYPPIQLPKHTCYYQSLNIYESQEEYHQNTRLKDELERQNNLILKKHLLPDTWTQMCDPKNQEIQLRVLMQENMIPFIEQRRKLFEKNVFYRDKNYLYSGECDVNFQIQITGIDNLYQILEQAFTDEDKKFRASYNGSLPPKYITKEFEWVHAEEEGEKPQRIDRVEGSVEQQKPIFKLIPLKKTGNIILDVQRDMSIIDPDVKKRRIMERLQKSFIDHGPQGSKYFQKFADPNYYDLNFPPYLISIQVKLLYGNKLLGPKTLAETRKIPFNKSPRWNQMIQFENPIKISQLPLESRLGFNVIIYDDQCMKCQVIASTYLDLFDENSEFQSGVKGMNLWPFFQIQQRLVCMNEYWGININKVDRPVERSEQLPFVCREFSRMYVQLDTFCDRMFWSLRDHRSMASMGYCDHIKKSQDIFEMTPSNESVAKLQSLLKKDPLSRDFQVPDQLILIQCRNHYQTIPQGLEIFLTAVDWSNPEHIREAYNMLPKWVPLSPEESIPLIDVHFADQIIRLYSVEQLSQMPDDQISLYMVELVQALMFETQHYNPLSQMLLERALQSPHIVGQCLFWQLRSQLHLRASYQRFAIILEQLLMLCGDYRDILIKETKINDKVMGIAQGIKKIGEQQRLVRYRQQLKQMGDEFQKDFGTFGFAIDNRLDCKNFVAEQCKIMNSKQLPLWLVMQNDEEGAEKIMLIFKDGDDIRQDLLTLQLIRIMDKIWLDNGYDYRMKPYQVLSSLDMVGMIEIVQNSDTTAAIHRDMGGTLGALQENTITKWLRQQSGIVEGEKPDPEKEQIFNKSQENFLYSCAGYCVATYVLGIGDRHSDNIMLTKSGHLFHIDFGHFLGNFKSQFGVQRERAPFVFTDEMAFVMGGTKSQTFADFEVLCANAYNLIRKHGNFLINVFRIMIAAGMPELSDPQDIEYLVKQLSLSYSEQEATNKFKKEIRDALAATSRRLDNLIHELKRG